MDNPKWIELPDIDFCGDGWHRAWYINDMWDLEKDVDMPEQAAAVHELKTWPEYFNAVMDGTKKAEIRKNDRGFKVRDALLLSGTLTLMSTPAGL
ncbi:MAG: hypothetical protein K0R47_1364 [Brevibacillus sp.]|nr:hypothetical protein [Brevibacillus sp.]